MKDSNRNRPWTGREQSDSTQGGEDPETIRSRGACPRQGGQQEPVAGSRTRTPEPEENKGPDDQIDTVGPSRWCPVAFFGNPRRGQLEVAGLGH